MKPMRILLAAFAVVVVAGAVAQAARQHPTVTPVSHARPATMLSSGTDSAGPSESEPAESDPSAGDSASAAVPDFTACAGLTGLDNAICRVQANDVAHPNTGLVNALSHLQANQAAQASRATSASTSAPGNSAAGLAHAPVGVIPGS